MLARAWRGDGVEDTALLFSGSQIRGRLCSLGLSFLIEETTRPGRWRRSRRLRSAQPGVAPTERLHGVPKQCWPLSPAVLHCGLPVLGGDCLAPVVPSPSAPALQQLRGPGCTQLLLERPRPWSPLHPVHFSLSTIPPQVFIQKGHWLLRSPALHVSQGPRSSSCLPGMPVSPQPYLSEDSDHGWQLSKTHMNVVLGATHLACQHSGG